MEFGSVVAEVFASNAMLPLRGATVYVTGENDRELLGVRTTNSSGKTLPVTVEAPPRDLSLAPEEEQPFSLTNVYVRMEGYYNMVVIDVQVFSGQTSLQRVQMVPLPLNYTGDNTEIIRITPQNL